MFDIYTIQPLIPKNNTCNNKILLKINKFLIQTWTNLAVLHAIHDFISQNDCKYTKREKCSLSFMQQKHDIKGR